jgi:putative DNA primase/helicase
MTAAGIETPPAKIVADGRVHRFASTPGRGASAWYIAHSDPVAPVWSFGDWRLGIKERGEGDPGRVLDPAEITARRQRFNELRTKIQFEARQRWDRCRPAAATHGYLKSKGIDPCGTRMDGDNLLVPMRDIDGKLWSLQEIAADGRKHNQEGGRRKECFFQIGEIGETFCVGEGFSTCASIHKATGFAVVSAGEAGNLECVATALRGKYPAATMVICGDDDWLTRVNGKTKNVGKLAAKKTAEAVGGVLALPWFFGSARPAWATDFNDMAKLHGLDQVADRIKLDLIKFEEDREAAQVAEPPPVNGPEDFGLPGSVNGAGFSDDALALHFAELHGPELRFVALWGRWLKWDGSRWVFDDRLRCFDMVRKICREAAAGANDGSLRRALASAKTVAAVERLARSDQRLAATTDQWDADLWKLNTPAGAVDLRTGNLTPPAPDDYATKITAVAPGGACPLWRTFIARITGGDARLAAFIQRMLGYSLTGSTQEHALFFCYGTGANGKSVLLKTAASILQKYHTTAPIETFTASSSERHPTDVAGLRGARLVSSVETQQGRRWDETKIKLLTGGDEVSARLMRQDCFEFVPQFKLVIAGNHKPGLRDVDEAIRRRFYLVPFTVTIPSAERDQGLTETLKSEWPGILKWMIEGCLDWQCGGLDPPAAVRDATAAYLESEDAIASWLGDCCRRDPQAWENSTALFGSWTIWANRAGETVGSQRTFVQNLEKRDGFHLVRRRDGRGFQGLRITPATNYNEYDRS